MNKFSEHLDALNNYDFWANTNGEAQTITSYDHLLCQKGPISKQTCHDYFARDIRYIIDHFQGDRELVHHAKKLRQSLNNIKNDVDNKEFWADLAPRLMMIHYEKPIAEDELKLAGIRKATQMINSDISNKRPNDQVIETRNRKQKRVNEGTEMEKVEHDGVFVSNSRLSVGTIIKRKALELFYKKTMNKLTPRERKIVSNGLSSILDLTDNSTHSQRSLFSKDDWSNLLTLFRSELKPELETVPLTLVNIWKVLCDTVIVSGDVELGIEYIQKIYLKQDRCTRVYLDLFKHILNLLINYPEYLCKGNEDDHSESDLLRIVWSPILEVIFPKKNQVQVKTGETINGSSQQQKKELYSDIDNVKAFKIDIRVIHKKNKTEYDIVSGEIAIDDEDTKLVVDEGKICRETKDAVDSMISLIGSPVQAFGIQCAGSACLVTVQSLARNGLYVYLPFFTFSLPTCVRDLETFLDTFQKLLTLEKQVLQTSQLLQHHAKEKESFKSLGRHDENDLEESALDWRRETFYSPPNKNSEPRIPRYIFGTSSSGFVSRLLSTKHSEGEKAASYDAFGWGKKGDKWHNKITDETLDESPYGN